MFSEQYKTRNKYEKIKCPECNSTSKVIRPLLLGIEKRQCKQGHVFYYSYLHEAITNWALNYKIKF